MASKFNPDTKKCFVIGCGNEIQGHIDILVRKDGEVEPVRVRVCKEHHELMVRKVKEEQKKQGIKEISGYVPLSISERVFTFG